MFPPKSEKVPESPAGESDSAHKSVPAEEEERPTIDERELTALELELEATPQAADEHEEDLEAAAKAALEGEEPPEDPKAQTGGSEDFEDYEDDFLDESAASLRMSKTFKSTNPIDSLEAFEESNTFEDN